MVIVQENTELDSYFFQTGKTQGILLKYGRNLGRLEEENTFTTFIECDHSVHHYIQHTCTHY